MDASADARCILCQRYCPATYHPFTRVIVDDDESVRESLPDMVRQFGFAVRAFPSAEAFLASEFVSETSCLILDVTMPGMSGPDLQRELASRRQLIPIVFITAWATLAIRRAPACPGRCGVPVQAVRRDGPARRAQRRAADGVAMPAMSTGSATRAPITLPPAIGSRSTEVTACCRRVTVARVVALPLC